MTAKASNLALRVATAVVGVPVILALLYLAPPWAFYVFIFAASLVGVRELFAMTHPGDALAQAMGLAVSAVASLALYAFPNDVRVALTLLVVVPVFGPVFTLVRLGAIETAALRACALGFGPLFVVIPLTLLAVMKKTLGAAGPGAVLLALGLAWMGDSVAYFAGRLLGRRKLYEAVSPKKTVEGALGGLLGSVAWAVFASLWFLPVLPLRDAVPFSLWWLVRSGRRGTWRSRCSSDRRGSRIPAPSSPVTGGCSIG